MNTFNEYIKWLEESFSSSPEIVKAYKPVTLIFAWPCIIDVNNIDNQLDATITAYW